MMMQLLMMSSDHLILCLHHHDVLPRYSGMMTLLPWKQYDDKIVLNASCVQCTKKIIYILYTIILEKFTSQNFQFKIIQPKIFSSLKVADENFYG